MIFAIKKLRRCLRVRLIELCGRNRRVQTEVSNRRGEAGLEKLRFGGFSSVWRAQTEQTPPAPVCLPTSLQLLRLGVDHDGESAPWKLGKSWEDLNSVDRTENFQDGIDELDGNKTGSLWAEDLRYLVFTINGALKYHLVEILDRWKPLSHYWKATVILSDVYFTVSETQYYWCINLLEALSRYNTRLEVSHLRPDVPVLKDTHAWWRYAVLASLQQKKLCCWFSWKRIKHLCQLRRLYVQMYSTFLKRAPNVDFYAMRKIERSLDSEVVLLWRWLARSAVRRNCPAYGCRMAGKLMNLRQRLLRFHPPVLRNAPKSSVWRSHLPL
ncbi:hypothetical protein KSP40_PGU000030 [Platanthera guangdongensis]|uniref:Uncharacterized protein n=1 Tax=Platanthera guangdongensis TaxID=2320717 RepID=A0ABR2M6Y0_9ASPA